jgi:TPR repeat protein
MRSLLLLIGSCAMLAGCVAPVVNGARAGIDIAKRHSLSAKATAGDAQAQYKLGNTYCCESGPEFARSLSIRDNQKATEWLCRAAVQSYGPAQYELARLYAGHESGGFGPVAWISAPFRRNKESAWPSAWVWASLAASNGVRKAVKLRDESFRRLSSSEQQSVLLILDDWHDQPCTWKQVLSHRS